MRALHSFDEVVVGAPMYSILPTDTQALVAEAGRFYTFFNSEVHMLFMYVYVCMYVCMRHVHVCTCVLQYS